MGKPAYGSIGWIDLTVKQAKEVKDFYRAVTGWKSEDVSMGEYNDYNMLREDGEPVAGVCHARGGNSELPAQWLIYINVADLDNSIDECIRLGGNVISGPKEMGKYGRYCVIKDPAGAVCALFEPKI